MEMPIPLLVRRVTREELYQMVWDKPMIRLAEEFGITGNGLAKVCDRLDVPYPPRGHWAKKEAGKPVVTLKLPPRRDGIPSATDIYPTPPKPACRSVTRSSGTSAVCTGFVEGATITLMPRPPRPGTRRLRRGWR